MTEEKRRFKTTIAGRNYTILAKKPEEHLKTVSEIVNMKINQIKTAMPALDIEQRSVLVAVNAISESISKQVEVDELKKQLSELEKKNESQKRMIQFLETQRKENPEDTAGKEAVVRQKDRKESLSYKPAEKAAESSKSAKQAGSRFVRPTTASGVVLQRVSSTHAKSNRRESNSLPPYVRKKQINESKDTNSPTEKR